MIRTPSGVLPAVALIIGVTLTACGEYDGIQRADDSATSSSPQPEAKRGDVVIDIGELPKGSAPKIAWLDGRTLHDGDRAVRLGAGSDQVGVVKKRIVELDLTQTGTGTEVQVRNRRGDITARYPNPTSRLVTNAKRNIVAWIAEDNTPMVLQAGHSQAAELPREPRGSNGDAVAVLGNDCFNGPETVEGAGCSVYFTLARKNRTLPFVASEHGFVARADTKIVQLLDFHENRARIGTMDAADGKLCSRYETDDTSYETCDHILDTFSPDGKNVIGYGPEITEGPATDAISVVDARTGKSRLTFRSPPDTFTIWETVWEDDEHVLAVVNQDDSTWAIVRVGLDGKAELAAGPKDDTESTTVFGFAVQP